MYKLSLHYFTSVGPVNTSEQQLATNGREIK